MIGRKFGDFVLILALFWVNYLLMPYMSHLTLRLGLKLTFVRSRCIGWVVQWSAFGDTNEYTSFFFHGNCIRIFFGGTASFTYLPNWFERILPTHSIWWDLHGLSQLVNTMILANVISSEVVTCPDTGQRKQETFCVCDFLGKKTK